MRIAILFLLLTTLAAADVCTTAGTGAMNWSNGARWTCGRAPGAGDTAVVNHAVTVDQSTVIGMSGEANTTAITINSSGSLELAPGATLTLRGDVAQANATITLGCGSIWEWDSTVSGAGYKANGTAHGQTKNIIRTAGDCSANPVKVRSTGDANGYFAASYLESGQWDVQGIEFDRIGTATTPALRHYLTKAGNVFRLHNFRFSNSGGVRRSGNSPSHGGTIFSVRDGVWEGTLTSYSLDFHAAATRTTGTWEVRRCYLDKRLGDGSSPPNLKGFTFTHNVFSQIFNLSGGEWDAFEWNVVVDPRKQSNDTNIYGDVKNSYFVETADTNPHFMSFASTTRNQTAEGLILHYAGSGSDGDGILVGATAPTLTHTFRNNLVLPAESNMSSSTLITFLGSNEPPRAVIEHNTYPGSTGAEHGIQYSETVSGGTPTGTVVSFKSNLYWAPAVIEGENHFNPMGALNVNMALPENISHNGSWNAGTTNLPGSTSHGTVYHIRTSDTVPGAGDVTGDPKFVDPTRNIMRWAARKYGADGTLNGALEVLKTNPGARIEELMEWVRAGFAPQNPAYKNSAHDGGDIGAVPAAALKNTGFTGSLYSNRTVVY